MGQRGPNAFESDVDGDAKASRCGVGAHVRCLPRVNQHCNSILTMETPGVPTTVIVAVKFLWFVSE